MLETIQRQIKEPLFVFERLEDGVPVWAFQHLCHLALLDTKTSTLIITGTAVNLFNPSSIPSLEEVQIGDLINCTADPAIAIASHGFNEQSFRDMSGQKRLKRKANKERKKQ